MNRDSRHFHCNRYIREGLGFICHSRAKNIRDFAGIFSFQNGTQLARGVVAEASVANVFGPGVCVSEGS